MTQERFWKELFQLKVQTLFVQKLLLQAEQNERLTKIFFAITSSASIGAWVIWKDLAWIWGGIIAGSQVLSAIYPYLPYRERQKNYEHVLKELENLFLDAEHVWPAIADGSMSIRQIQKELNQLGKKKFDILHKHVPGAFPSKPQISLQAEKEAMNYFAYFYPQEEQLEQNSSDMIGDAGKND